MSTPNFMTQAGFDLYCYDGSAREEDIKDMREANEYDKSISDEQIAWWIEEDNYRFTIEEFPYILKETLSELGKDLQFHNIELESGYYEGLQFYVKLDKDLANNYGNTSDEVLKYIDNEDTRYYYDMCKSEFKRKLLQEERYINKKVFPLLAKKTGFEQYACIGIFSNGEAVYKKIA